MNGITEKLLGIVSDWAGSFNGAFNIRPRNGSHARRGRHTGNGHHAARRRG